MLHVADSSGSAQVARIFLFVDGQALSLCFLFVPATALLPNILPENEGGTGSIPLSPVCQHRQNT